MRKNQFSPVVFLHLPFKAGLWYTCGMKYFKSIVARLICLFVLAFAGYSRADDVVGVVRIDANTNGLVEVMPDGKICKCATAEDLQKCVQDKTNWSIGSYAPILGGRNCGTWVEEVARRCCMKAKFYAPWFDSNAEGCGNIGGPIIFGPSYGWKWQTTTK